MTLEDNFILVQAIPRIARVIEFATFYWWSCHLCEINCWASCLVWIFAAIGESFHWPAYIHDTQKFEVLTVL